MIRCCEKCGAKRSFRPGAENKHSKHRNKSDHHHTLCQKCYRSLRSSQAPKSAAYISRPGVPISECPSIFDPGGKYEPVPAVVNRLLIGLGFLPGDIR